MQQRLQKFNQHPWVTYALLAIMVIVFALMILAGGSENPRVLLAFGAQSNELINAGQWWRLITPIFVHIGYQHIILNGITIFYVGRILENVFGHWRYFVVFMVAGIVGNLTTFSFGSGLAAGSSTSLFGLFGAFIMLAVVFKNDDQIVAMGKTFLLFVVINLIFDLILPGIDIWGHIGGFIGGFLISFVVGLPHSKAVSKKCSLFYANALIIVIIFLYYLGTVR